MTRKVLTVLIMCFYSFQMFAQEPVQNIKGRVIDATTQVSLPGVNIFIAGTNPPKGTTTNAEGYYVLENVLVGRYTIQFSYIGYEPAVFREVSVGSAKEVELNAQLKESFKQLDEVVVKPVFRTDRAQNSMATLSSRSFSVEEASRYAGGWNDPSRLAGSFAGVTMAEGVNDNSIVVRGNAPKGILWRLEGVEIPAPNHLNGVNNGGGIETVFSVNMLTNSDFYTGAFPAEYANAMSGVFDMKFRNGNTSKRESAFQIGSQGIDISSEGPFNSKHKSSYLFNYRYSTLGLAGLFLGADYGLPTYQDFSFKLYLPTSDAGTFSVWGIGGLSNVKFEPEENPDEWDDTFDNNKYDTGSDIAATGITHQVCVGKGSYLKSSVAYTFDRFKMESNQLQRDGTIFPLANHNEDNSRIILNSFINTRISNRLTSKIGANYIWQGYNLNIEGNANPGVDEELSEIASQDGSVQSARAFLETKWRITPKIDLNAGINTSYFGMNEEFIVEPRVGLSWKFLSKHTISAAYGKHSRLEPIRFYQAEDEFGNLLNPNLKVTKANHYVFSYEYRINANLALKIEPYYQDLSDVPVINGSSESLLNYTWDMYFEDPLVNKGTGTNLGVDINLEHYMKDGFYYLSTGSIFDSKYKGGDGIERNTSFNRNFVFNVLGGKEWSVRRNNIFGLNGKIAYIGGNRFTPANQEASKLNEMVVLDGSRAFEWQEKNRLFIDLALSYRINKNNKAHILGLQAKNLLMEKEMFGWAYDFKQQKVVEHGEAMVYPFFTYKLEF